MRDAFCGAAIVRSVAALVVFTAVFLVPSFARADEAHGVPIEDLRFEIGLRLRAFEEIEPTCTDLERRKLAVAELDRAVRQFLTGQFELVATGMDRARRLLEGKDPATAWSDQLSVTPKARVLAGDVDEIPILVRRAYAGGIESWGDAVPDDAWIEVQWGSSKPTRWPVKLGAVSMPRPASTWSSDDATRPQRDGHLTLRVGRGDVTLREWNDEVSIVPGVTDRLDRLEQRTAAFADRRGVAGTLVATARGMGQRVRLIAGGLVPELPFPVNGALDRVEDLLDRVENDRVPSHAYGVLGADGDQWVVFRSQDGATCRSRMWLPPISKDETRPLVIAVHGAGGSENAFFNAYGAGEVVKLAKKRGWIVVAPRRAFFGSMGLDVLTDTLIDQLPVDRKQVFLVGHSMGAMQSVDAACRAPKKFAAVACLGGGGRVVPSEALREIPFWVATGDQDFARGGARMLRDALRRHGVECEWRLLPVCEHMLVVRLSLPDVFDFFAKAGEARKEPPTAGAGQ